jgi:hypothetical protein
MSKVCREMPPFRWRRFSSAGGRFRNKRGGWDAFEDANLEGYRRREAHLGRS